MKAYSMLVAAVLLGACAQLQPASQSQPMLVAPAPISSEGNVGGQPTDLVFVLVKDADPTVPGIALARGERLMVLLPKDFVRDRSVQVREDSDFNLVLTRGWPQASVPQKDQYRIVVDDAANAIGVRADTDVPSTGRNAPGIKVVHLRGATFQSPLDGEYPVQVGLEGADGRVRETWTGKATILANPPKARLAPTNFHLPPGTNSDFQRTRTGQVATHWMGLLLWGPAGSPLNGVGVAPADRGRYPKYTGGLLVQDTNGDHKLDSATDRVVGGIIGQAPPGAQGQSATSPAGADGRPILSGEILRDAKYPAGGGKPNPGLLPIQFRAGSMPGKYQPTFELIDGNNYQFTIQAQ
jgi:hypothetical protein